MSSSAAGTVDATIADGDLVVVPRDGERSSACVGGFASLAGPFSPLEWRETRPPRFPSAFASEVPARWPSGLGTCEEANSARGGAIGTGNRPSSSP